MNPEHLLIHRRHAARRLAMQAIYQWQIAGHNINELFEQFQQDVDYPKVDTEYFEALVRGVTVGANDLDALLAVHLSRPMGQVDPVERAVLRIATLELRDRLEIPYKVVLDEAIGLSRKFGATDSHKFINGVLDKVLPVLRSIEMSAAKK